MTRRSSPRRGTRTRCGGASFALCPSRQNVPSLSDRAARRARELARFHLGVSRAQIVGFASAWCSAHPDDRASARDAPVDRERTLALMRRHREDVLWDAPGSRAYLHLIREAALFDGGTWAAGQPGNHPATTAVEV